MGTKLVVREPFAYRDGAEKRRFGVGDEITDPAIIAAVAASPQSNHVVRVAVTDEPVAKVGAKK